MASDPLVASGPDRDSTVRVGSCSGECRVVCQSFNRPSPNVLTIVIHVRTTLAIATGSRLERECEIRLRYRAQSGGGVRLAFGSYAGSNEPLLDRNIEFPQIVGVTRSFSISFLSPATHTRGKNESGRKQIMRSIVNTLLWLRIDDVDGTNRREVDADDVWPTNDLPTLCQLWEPGHPTIFPRVRRQS